MNVKSRTARGSGAMAMAAVLLAGCTGAQPPALRDGYLRGELRRHLADLRARSGLTTEQLIYAGRAGDWLVVPSLEPG